MNDIEFEFEFSDITMLESGGSFGKVKEIMTQSIPTSPPSHKWSLDMNSLVSEEWMVRTDISISSQYGVSALTAHFYHDGQVLIVSYNPSTGNVFYNPDIQALSEWCQQNGWKVPSPKEDLIRDNLDFWKHYYDTLIIDSDYLDDIYGKRPQISGDMPDFEDEDEDEDE